MHASPPLQFAADAMLGRLARWLRVLGFDTTYDDAIADPALVELADVQDRILLTRDRRLLRELRPARSHEVRSDLPLEQLRSVVLELALPAPQQLFTRCILDNTELSAALPHAQALALVPPLSRQAAGPVRRCATCGRVYWHGSHARRMRVALERTLPGWLAPSGSTAPRQQPRPLTAGPGIPTRAAGPWPTAWPWCPSYGERFTTESTHMNDDKQLKGVRVAILACSGVEQAELAQPRKALDEAGAKTTLISVSPGSVQAFHHHDKGDKFDVQATFEHARPDDFDAVLLPGGALNADQLRTTEGAQKFVQAMQRAGKPFAIICHAPWLLVSAGLVPGRHLTSWPSIQDDIRNAGGTWSDQEVVHDGNWVSSRKPADIPAFNRAMIELFAHQHAAA